MQETCYQCRHCGRKIVAHNLGEWNLVRHETACVSSNQKKRSKRYQKELRRAATQARRTGIGSTIVPGAGQLGFPFEGVEEEIVE